MTNEELYLKTRIGNKNPFQVPEGYFDQFATELMKQLPQEKGKPMAKEIPIIHRLRPLFYVAACLFIAIMSITIYFNNADAEDDAAQMASASEMASDTFFEEATEYAMVDNTDIYACLMND